jgi:hypothetical protein
MMFFAPRARPLVTAGALGAGPLLAGTLLLGCGQPGPGAAQQAGATGQAQVTPIASASQARVAQPAAGRFSAPLTVDNPMFPLVAGTQFVYRGTIVEGGVSKPHSVVFTVTDLSKMVDHVRTAVAWDRDFLDGKLQEQELAFFAQDDKGNVWNFGEYPEEYEHGKFAGAPSTWIRGTAGAYGGIHMLSQPRVGARYREGLVPAIEFDDVSRVARTGQVTCVQADCYRQVLVVDETSPNDPTSGHQIKYYSPRAGLIRVAARGGDSQEFLTLAAVRHLDGHAMAKIRAAALAMDRRAYRVSKVYRATNPAERRG